MTKKWPLSCDNSSARHWIEPVGGSGRCVTDGRGGGTAPVRSGCDPQAIAPHGLYALQGFSGVGVSPSVCAGPAKVCSVQYALGRPRVRPSTADRTRSTWLKPLVMKEITNTATSTGRTLRISAYSTGADVCTESTAVHAHEAPQPRVDALSTARGMSRAKPKRAVTR